nr:hypothetical protein [Stenotrophomonas pavanii]
MKKNAGLRRRFPFPAEMAAVLFVHCEAGQTRASCWRAEGG